MEFTNEALINDKDFPEFITVGTTFDIEIQIFTDNGNKEIVTITKI